jgi:hypothetical protein
LKKFVLDLLKSRAIGQQGGGVALSNEFEEICPGSAEQWSNWTTERGFIK